MRSSRVPRAPEDCVRHHDSQGSLLLTTNAVVRKLDAVLATVPILTRGGGEIGGLQFGQTLTPIATGSLCVQVVKQLAAMEGRSLLAAAATQALRMAGVKQQGGPQPA